MNYWETEFRVRKILLVRLTACKSGIYLSVRQAIRNECFINCGQLANPSRQKYQKYCKF